MEWAPTAWPVSSSRQAGQRSAVVELGHFFQFCSCLLHGAAMPCELVSSSTPPSFMSAIPDDTVTGHPAWRAPTPRHERPIENQETGAVGFTIDSAQLV